MTALHRLGGQGSTMHKPDRTAVVHPHQARVVRPRLSWALQSLLSQPGLQGDRDAPTRKIDAEGGSGRTPRSPKRRWTAFAG